MHRLQGGMSCFDMRSYFSQRSCSLARHWYPTTPSPGAVEVAVAGAEVAVCTQVVFTAADITSPAALARAIRSRVGQAGQVVRSPVVRVTRDARSRDARAIREDIIPERRGAPPPSVRL